MTEEPKVYESIQEALLEYAKIGKQRRLKMNEEIQKYFSILIDSLYARIQGNEEEEDLLLGYLDKIWHNLTPEQIEIISKIIKQFRND